MKRKTLRHKRRARKTRKGKGGVRLGKGAFGAVYHPGIPCKGKNPTEYVTKVLRIGGILTHEGALNTIKRLKTISAKLKEIDPNQDFFLYPEFCEEFEDGWCNNLRPSRELQSETRRTNITRTICCRV
jgi:hypothetical protein